jgi:outer membrane protein TolC
VESVLTAYYDVALLQEQLAALRVALSVSGERARLAEARRSLGAGSRLEQLQALADRNADSSAVMTQELALRAARITLSGLLARDVSTGDSAFSVLDGIPVETAPPMAAWRAALGDRNAAVASARAARKAAALSVNEARGAHLPTLAGSVGYSESPSKLNGPATTAPGATTYGLNLTLPLFDGLRTSRGAASARIAERRSEIALRQAEQEAAAGFAEASGRHAAGVRQIDLEERNLEVARLQAEAARERYKAGAASPLEFRDAQQRLLAARSRLASVRQSTLRAGLALRRLSGTLASPSGDLASPLSTEETPR